MKVKFENLKYLILFLCLNIFSVNTNNILLYLSLDNEQEIFAYGGNLTYGIFNNSYGKWNGGLKFNNNGDFLKIPVYDTYSGNRYNFNTNEGTIMFWVRPLTNLGNLTNGGKELYSYMFELTGEYNFNQRIVFYRQASDNKLAYKIANSTNSVPLILYGSSMPVDTSLWTTNTWTHITFTWKNWNTGISNGEFRFYTNGIEVYRLTNRNIDGFYNIGENMYFGNGDLNGGYVDYLSHMAFDEIYIFNKSLTSNEITNYMKPLGFSLKDSIINKTINITNNILLYLSFKNSFEVSAYGGEINFGTWEDKIGKWDGGFKSDNAYESIKIPVVDTIDNNRYNFNTNEGTIMFWVKPLTNLSLITNGIDSPPVFFESVGENHFYQRFFIYRNISTPFKNIFFSINNSTNQSGGTHLLKSSIDTSIWNTNTWYHLAFTWKNINSNKTNGVMKAYFNGFPAGELLNQDLNNLIRSGSNYFFGSGDTKGNYYKKSSHSILDEIYIFNKALDFMEIKKYMNKSDYSPKGSLNNLLSSKNIISSQRIISGNEKIIFFINSGDETIYQINILAINGKLIKRINNNTINQSGFVVWNKLTTHGKNISTGIYIIQIITKEHKYYKLIIYAK